MRLAMLFPIQWNEPFGLVMIEAMACGTPVLALPGGAVEEVVRDGISGFRMPVRRKTWCSCASGYRRRRSARRTCASIASNISRWSEWWRTTLRCISEMADEDSPLDTSTDQITMVA